MRDAGALANALDDVGTKVNDEIAFVRMLADLDLDHIRVLKIMIRRPKHLDRVAVQMNAADDPRAARQWYAWSIVEADPGRPKNTPQQQPTRRRRGLRATDPTKVQRVTGPRSSVGPRSSATTPPGGTVALASLVRHDLLVSCRAARFLSPGPGGSAFLTCYFGGGNVR